MWQTNRPLLSTHNFRDFFGLPNPFSPRLENNSLSPLRLRELEEAPSLLEEFRKKEWVNPENSLRFSKQLSIRIMPLTYVPYIPCMVYKLSLNMQYVRVLHVPTFIFSWHIFPLIFCRNDVLIYICYKKLFSSVPTYVRTYVSLAHT